MSSFTSPRERGFTLIEMSIVLVIIGLIIGGILKGQELVESARQKNVISQIDSVRAAVNSFQDRYKSLPGDFGQATTRIAAIMANGNDDGTISSAAVNAYPTTAAGLAAANKSTGEEFQFWNHMAGANVLGGGTATVTTTAQNFSGGAVPSPLPAAAFPQTGLSMIYGTHPGSGATADGKTTNWIVVSKFGASVVQVAQTTGATSGQRAFQMDNKYDDGLPMSGTIRTFGLTGNCGTTGNDAYAATATGLECEIVFAQ